MKMSSERKKISKTNIQNYFLYFLPDLRSQDDFEGIKIQPKPASVKGQFMNTKEL
jgi:hypothetical protein